MINNKSLTCTHVNSLPILTSLRAHAGSSEDCAETVRCRSVCPAEDCPSGRKIHPFRFLSLLLDAFGSDGGFNVATSNGIHHGADLGRRQIGLRDFHCGRTSGDTFTLWSGRARPLVQATCAVMVWDGKVDGVFAASACAAGSTTLFRKSMVT